MSDSQWPRYEVFLQAAPGEPHQHAGSVHAPDSEMALLHARDVFVRRPECSSLWVAPAELVITLSSEQMDALDAAAAGEAEKLDYVVFWKQDHRGTLTEAGRVRAPSPEAALRQARAQTSEGGWRWAAVPLAALTASRPEEADPFFDPARHKPFRHHSFYKTVAAMYRIKKARRKRSRSRSHG